MPITDCQHCRHLEYQMEELSTTLAEKEQHIKELEEPYTSLETFLVNNNESFTHEELEKIGLLIMEPLLSDREKTAKAALFISRLCQTAENAESQLTRAKEALRFYAENMGQSKSKSMRIFVQDGGQRARDILEADDG